MKALSNTKIDKEDLITPPNNDVNENDQNEEYIGNAMPDSAPSDFSKKVRKRKKQKQEPIVPVLHLVQSITSNNMDDIVENQNQQSVIEISKGNAGKIRPPKLDDQTIESNDSSGISLK